MKFHRLAATLLVALPFVTTHAQAQDAKLTVLHGVPGLSAPVDVFANGSQLFSFDYGDQQGPLSLAAGAYAIDIQLNGSSILSANVNLAADTDYSAIAHLDASGSPTVSLFTNDTASLTLPASRLTVRHTAQAPAVDVVLSQNGSRVATFGNLSNPNEVAADVAPGTYSAELFVAGTNNRAFGPVDVRLENGYSYAVYAVGDVSAPSFRLLIQRGDLAARVTVVHGIPGLPAPVDVFAGNSQLFSFDFGDIEGPLVLNPGQYALSVRLQGQTVLSASPTVAAGDNVSIVAHLDATGASNQLSVFPNDISDLATGARLSVRHTAAAPTVDVGLDAGGSRFATISNLSNGQNATAEVPSGIYEANLFAAGTSQRAFGPAVLKPASDVHYLVYAIGDLNAGSFTLAIQTIDLGFAAPGDLTATVLGQGCGPVAAVSSAQVDFGAPFTIFASGSDASTMGVLNVGDSDTSFGVQSLPASLAAIGAPGCFLNVNVVAVHPIVTDANGDASATLFVPNSTFGSLPDLYFQFATMTRSNALGVVTSDYVELRQN